VKTGSFWTDLTSIHTPIRRKSSPESVLAKNVASPKRHAGYLSKLHFLQWGMAAAATCLQVLKTTLPWVPAMHG